MSKLCLISLGCSKNLVNSEKILAEYAKCGTVFVNTPEEADEIIINTCCFIDSAIEESINTIREMSRYNAKLYVSGCLVERFGDEIFDVLPEVDGIINAEEKRIEKDSGRLLSTPRGVAYLKIAEGCNNRCTFCVIPEIKGEYVSFSHKDILDEAKTLAKQGVRELIIIAQDTTAYNDKGYKLSDLLKDLAKIKGIHWLRLHYCYPELVTNELIKVIKNEAKVVKYIDIPIQHCNDEILKNMGRKSREDELKNLIERLRGEVKEITIRTSLMVGFPGETEEIFEELCDFVREIRFERLGVFEFSPQEGTVAFNFSDQVEENEKHRRFEKLMQIQKEITEKHNNEKIGRNIEVIVQEIHKDKIIARSAADSLDIDGLVYISGETNANIGDFLNVKIIGADGYDLIAVI